MILFRELLITGWLRITDSHCNISKKIAHDMSHSDRFVRMYIIDVFHIVQRKAHTEDISALCGAAIDKTKERQQ